MQRFADDVGGPCGQKGGNHAQRRFAQAHQQERHEPAEDNSRRDAPDGQTNETQRRLACIEGTGQRGGDREPIEHQTGRVVDQAFPLQQYGDAWRQGKTLKHGLGGDGIGRGDDRAQCEASGPGKRRLDPVGHDSDDEGGEGDRADRQLKDDAQIGPEVAPDREIGAGKKQRRQEQHQRQIRVELDIGHAGNEGERYAAEDEGCRRRHSQAACQHLKADDGGHQHQNELKSRDYRQVQLTLHRGAGNTT